MTKLYQMYFKADKQNSSAAEIRKMKQMEETNRYERLTKGVSNHTVGTQSQAQQYSTSRYTDRAEKRLRHSVDF